MKQTRIYVLACSESLFPSEQSQISWKNVLLTACFLKFCFKAQCKKISTKYKSIFFKRSHFFLLSIFLKIYLSDREHASGGGAGGERERERERESQADSGLSVEPDSGSIPPP